MKLSTIFTAAAALVLPTVWGQAIGDPIITSILVVEYIPAVSTSTVYQTTQITVFSCAPEVTNCPVRSATSIAQVTAIVGISTTICPVTFVSTRVSSYTTPASTSFAPTTSGASATSMSVISTTYSTASSTITIGSSSTSFSYYSTISYTATSTPSIVTTQATLYSGGPSLPTASTITGSLVESGSGSGQASASSATGSSVSSNAAVSSTAAGTSAVSSVVVVSTSIAPNGSSYTISYSPLGTGSLSSYITTASGSSGNISVPSGPSGSGPSPPYTGMAGHLTIATTALSALALGMIAAFMMA